MIKQSRFICEDTKLTGHIVSVDKDEYGAVTVKLLLDKPTDYEVQMVIEIYLYRKLSTWRKK